MLYGISRLVNTLNLERVCSKKLDPKQNTKQIEENRYKPVTPVRKTHFFQTVVFVVEKASTNKEVNKFTVIICTQIQC